MALNLTDPQDISFFNKLQTKFFAFDPNDNPTGLAEAGITGEGTTAQFDTLLASYGTMVTDPAQRKVFPRTWEEFVKQARVNGFGAAEGDPMSGPLFDGFFSDYMSILQAFGGDYSGVPTETLQTQFTESFTQFLKTYQFNVDKTDDIPPLSGPLDGAAGPTDFFISNFRKFMSVTAVNLTPFAAGDTSNVSSFQQIYQAFFPDGSPEDFVTMRNELIEDMRNDPDKGGYFIPSQFLHKWFEKVQDAYLTTQLGASSIKGTQGERLTIIWKLFKLVVDMIGTLQKVASVVAQRLNFLTSYQKAYTDLMADVPVFTKGDDSPFGGTDDDAASARQELNPKNQTLTENLRSFRTILSDEAKALQSNVNQLNESVNQQSSLAESILQEMSTILQGIYR
ncbi:MAG: hypothetical protein Q8K75_03780 [Chlamydiales bacterium]|nr:hypothetical protein [Chlamydiales bacterium]